MTPERQNELRRQIDQRFDQFSLDELRNADSGAMTFGSAFPKLSLRETEFAKQYFNRKMDELRTRLHADQKPAPPKELNYSRGRGCSSDYAERSGLEQK